MRYYIEAFDIDDRQILGNLDGQAALGDVRRPEQCKRWQQLVRGEVQASPRVATWRLVDEHGFIVRELTVSGDAVALTAPGGK